MGSFDTALSALQAFSSAMDAVGNNLANMSTTGFKTSEINFEDVMGTVTANNTQIGNGVQQPTTEADFSQGAITTTTNPLDAAIQGNGFFLLAPAGSTGTPSSYEYPRDGSFQIGADGTLQTADGANVQGWSLNPATGQVDTSGLVGNITIPMGTTLPAVATSTVSISANLNAAAAAGDSLAAFDHVAYFHQRRAISLDAGGHHHHRPHVHNRQRHPESTHHHVEPLDHRSLRHSGRRRRLRSDAIQPDVRRYQRYAEWARGRHAIERSDCQRRRDHGDV